jgi:hypothetical protein
MITRDLREVEDQMNVPSVPKRKKAYVPPEGGKIPPRPKDGTNCDLWLWFAETCRELRRWIPICEEPETMGWEDPYESRTKERFEKLEVEEQHSTEVRASFETLMASYRWPESSNAASFLMYERLSWSEEMARQIAKSPSPPGLQGTPFPCASLRDLWRWIAFELYDSSFRTPKKWWDSSSHESW